jgi:hypothetical protein
MRPRCPWRISLGSAHEQIEVCNRCPVGGFGDRVADQFDGLELRVDHVKARRVTEGSMTEFLDLVIALIVRRWR